jgi:chemosensory pili system protein ChpA (sensor histidine kinase/response regulator)
MDTDLNLWVNDQENFAALNNLMRYLHTLKGGANMIQATYIGLIAHELESIYERLIQKQLIVSSALIDFIRLVQDDLADRLQIVREQHLDYAASHTIQALKNAGQVFDSHIKESKTEPETYVIPELNFEVLQQEAINNTALNLSELTSASEQIAKSNNQLVEQTELQVLYADHDHTESIPDQDINTVVEQTFMEEAAELLEMADHLLMVRATY